MTVPVFHMASFSRSGETLTLRSLQAHPQIEVVHQIKKTDTPEDFSLFRTLQRSFEPSLPMDHPSVAHRDLKPDQVLLLKSAVWIHKAPWKGFILCRNPLSVVNSMRLTTNPDNIETQKQRLIRWARGIDPLLIPQIERVDNHVGLCILINRKMLADHASGNPIVHYERFVENPEKMLRKIIAHFGLEWDERVLRSHEDYSQGAIGHGNIKLDSAIHQGSQHSYQKISEEQRNEIYMYCAPVMNAYGYKYDGNTIELAEDFDDRFA